MRVGGFIFGNEKIIWQEFEQLELRVRTIIEANPFPEERKLA